ncbi:hypothetical protein [Spirosoma jeollabukense]
MKQLYLFVLFFLLLLSIKSWGQNPVIIKDINAGKGGSNASFMRVVNNVIIFFADDGKVGREVWKSDGTEAGTVLVKDINVGPKGCDVNLGGVVIFKDKMYFWVDDGVNGRELWRTDGTPSGTVLFFESVKGKESSFSQDLNNGYCIEYKNELYFIAKTASNSTNGLYKTDGSTVTLIKEYKRLNGLTVANDLLLFSGDDDEYGYELRKTDGTASGTSIVKDILPGKESSFPGNIGSIANKLLFVVDSNLMVSDGTASGTTIIKSINVDRSCIINGKAYFYNNNINNLNIWETDGTAAGTKEIIKIGKSVTNLFQYNNSLHYIVPASSNTSSGPDFMMKVDVNSLKIDTIGISTTSIKIMHTGKYLYWVIYPSSIQASIRYTNGRSIAELYRTFYGFSNAVEYNDFLYLNHSGTQEDDLKAGGEFSRIAIPNLDPNCQTFKAVINQPAATLLPCQGGTITLSATASGGATPYSYEWKRNSLVTGPKTATFGVSNAGRYEAIVTDAAGCQATTNTISITSVAPSVTISGSLSFCPGQNTVLSAVTDGNPVPYVYKWKYNNNDVGASSNLSVTKAGTYSVEVTNQGCTVSTSVEIKEITNLPVSITGNNTICAGTFSPLSATVSGGTGPYTYQWKQGTSNLFGSTSQVLSVTTTGTYSVSATDSKGCTGTSPGFDVTVKPSPTATITTATTSLTTGESATFVTPAASGQTYQWYNNGQPVPGATNNTYTTTQKGTFTVIVTRDGCSTTSQPITIQLVLATEPTLTSLGLDVSPNPVQQNADVRLSMVKAAPATFTLVDEVGKVIGEWKSPQVQRVHELTLPMKSQLIGIYFLRVEASGLQAICRILKQ